MVPLCPAVARLTQRIRSLADHMKMHRKDFHSRRGLEAVLARRRKLLTYLRGNDFDTYATLLTRLGLKDNYEKQVSPTAADNGDLHALSCYPLVCSLARGLACDQGAVKKIRVAKYGRLPQFTR